MQYLRTEREKEGNRKELEFISLNNRNSELARGEKPFRRVICKEFITLPQVFFLESILSNLEDFFPIQNAFSCSLSLLAALTPQN